MTPSDTASSSPDAAVDRELVRSVARGSADALACLYDRHAPRVFAMARRVVVRLEDAEEVVQDVFAQVWREAGRYEESRATVAGWMVMLARTRAIDRVRARRARPDQAAPVSPELTPLPADPAQGPELASMAEEDGRLVRAALQTLPEPNRSLVELAYYEGLTHTEIAARTSTPLGTVKTRLRTAMMALRAQLSGTRLPT